MSASSTRPIISSEDAIAFWLKGAEVWNKRFGQISADISFAGIDFTPYRTPDNPVISFAGFHFPSGNISFDAVNFGDGEVSFEGAIFGSGEVYFTNSRFGTGKLNFTQVYFEGELVTFANSDFGSSDIYFSLTNFNEASVDFSECVFNSDEVSFHEARFGSYVLFDKTNFGDGTVDFLGVRFGDKTVSFSSAVFGARDVIFSQSDFGKGDVFFNGTTFGSAEVAFVECQFDEGTVRFFDLKCETTAFNFDSIRCKASFLMRNISNIESLSFRAASFDNVLSISNVSVNGIVDLVNTRLTNQFSLHGIECVLQREKYLGILKKASNPDDVERANRLKDLAENNKHHNLALKFHGIEMRAKRWQPKTKALSSILDLLFDILCNYGQSVARPLLYWIGSIGIFALCYATLFKGGINSLRNIWDVVVFSFANSLPFLNAANEGRIKGLEKLFDASMAASYVLPLMMTQGVLSVLLLFLIGLGLRNRFRL